MNTGGRGIKIESLLKTPLFTESKIASTIQVQDQKDEFVPYIKERDSKGALIKAD